MYDIIYNLIAPPSNYANSNVITICGVLIVLVVVWFLDSLVKLFKL